MLRRIRRFPSWNSPEPHGRKLRSFTAAKRSTTPEHFIPCMANKLDPKRTVAELKELRALTGDANGAQRVAFTPTWVAARKWLLQKIEGMPLESHVDAAGNLWITLRGESERSLLIGGHIDSVPNGGWLDGCLNVMAGVEILRRLHAQYPKGPPITVRVVDWADEEGARFGKSLFGSSACSGSLNIPSGLRLQS